MFMTFKNNFIWDNMALDWGLELENVLYRSFFRHCPAKWGKCWDLVIKNLSAYKQKLQVYKREHLNILIMYERHFHFHFVVAARLYVNTNLFSHHCMVDLLAALCNVPSIQLIKHNSSLSKPHQVRAARFYKSRCSAMQPACVRHFWSNYFVITMDMIYMFL